MFASDFLAKDLILGHVVFVIHAVLVALFSCFLIFILSAERCFKFTLSGQKPIRDKIV